MENYYVDGALKLLQEAKEIVNRYSMAWIKDNDTKLVIPEVFKEEFFRLVDRVSLNLMEDRDNFYGYFLFQMRREVRFDIGGPTGFVFKGTGYVIFFNPLMYLMLSKEQMETAIKHEILHILSLHFIRAKAYKGSYDELAVNMAMDIVVNRFLDHLPPYATTLEWVNLQYSLGLKADESFESYLEKIQEALARMDQLDEENNEHTDTDNKSQKNDPFEPTDENYEITRDENSEITRDENYELNKDENYELNKDIKLESIQDENLKFIQVENLELNKDENPKPAKDENSERDMNSLDNLILEKDMIDNNMIKNNMIEAQYSVEKTHSIWRESQVLEGQLLREFTKKAVDQAIRGELSSYLSGFINALKETEEELPWNLYLRQLMGAIESTKKKTVTRRNRRQPERLELRGELRDHKANLIVALDISASISEGEFHQAMKEVLGIIRNYKHEITVVECDDEIRRVYKVRSEKDIQERSTEKGATRFQPVIDYANSAKVNLLVYFTDGKGEERLKGSPRGYKILWVISGRGDKISLREPYGVVKKLKHITSNEIEVEAGERLNSGFSMMNQEEG